MGRNTNRENKSSPLKAATTNKDCKAMRTRVRSEIETPNRRAVRDVSGVEGACLVCAFIRSYFGKSVGGGSGVDGESLSAN